MTLREVIFRTIREALSRNKGNKVRTAQELGIGRTSLYRKLEEFDDDPIVCVEKDFPLPMILSALSDPDLLSWLKNVCDPRRRAPAFLRTAAELAFMADVESYPVIRPALRVFQQRFPEYEDPAATK
jgi:hypothetical protein